MSRNSPPEFYVANFVALLIGLKTTDSPLRFCLSSFINFRLQSFKHNSSKVNAYYVFTFSHVFHQCITYHRVLTFCILQLQICDTQLFSVFLPSSDYSFPWPEDIFCNFQFSVYSPTLWNPVRKVGFWVALPSIQSILQYPFMPSEYVSKVICAFRLLKLGL